MAFVDLNEGILGLFGEVQETVPLRQRVFSNGRTSGTNLGLRVFAPGSEYYALAKNAGLCPDCHKPAVPGKSHCSVHLKARAAAVRDLKARYTGAGRCRCSRELDRDGKLCSICCAQAKVRNRRNYVPKVRAPRPKTFDMAAYKAQRTAAGLCLRCPNAAKPGRTRCEACTLKARKS